MNDSFWLTPSTFPTTRDKICGVRLSKSQWDEILIQECECRREGLQVRPSLPHPLTWPSIRCVVLSETIRMAPGTWWEGRPAGFLKVASDGSSGPTACWVRLRYRNATSRVRPCHARILNMSTCLRACAWHGVRPLRSRSRRQQEGFLFFRPPGRFFRSREVKKLLGPLWA